MGFVISHCKTGNYVKTSGSWATTLKHATKFPTYKEATGYLESEFEKTFKVVPRSDVKVLDEYNLLEGYDIQDVTFSDEEAIEELEKLKSFCEGFIVAVEKYASLYNHYRRSVKKLDLETMDLLHKIELTNENVVDGFRRYKQLQDIRQRRRSAKDAAELTGILLSSGVIPSVKIMKAEMEKMIEENDKREYRPRVLVDLFDR